MSKSLGNTRYHKKPFANIRLHYLTFAGNVIDPKDIIEGGPNQKEKPAYGADTLRLWISGVDYTSDVCVGTNIIKQVSEFLVFEEERTILRCIYDCNNAFHRSLKPTVSFATPYGTCWAA